MVGKLAAADLVWTLLGIALIAIAIRDIFDVLFHLLAGPIGPAPALLEEI